MTKDCLLSIIIPVYNVAPYFRKFLNTLFSQTLKDGIEFIFINDCCTDNSMMILSEMIKHYPGREYQIKIIDNPTNLGIANVRQQGLSTASGEYIGFCDSDDWLDLDYCRLFIETAKKYDADLVICDYYEERKGKLIPKLHKFERLSSNDLLRSLSGRENKSWGVLWNKLFRREIIQEYSFDSDINICEDTLMLFKVLSKDISIIHLPTNLYFYRKYREGSVKQNIDDEQLTKDFNLFNKISKLAEFSTDPDYKLSCLSFIQEQIISRAFRFSNLPDKEYKRIYSPYFSKGLFCHSFPKSLMPFIIISNKGWHRSAKKFFNMVYKLIPH